MSLEAAQKMYLGAKVTGKVGFLAQEIDGLVVVLPLLLSTATQCLKITKKVSFNIASEASYVYILSGQKLIENAKKLAKIKDSKM